MQDSLTTPPYVPSLETIKVLQQTQEKVPTERISQYVDNICSRFTIPDAAKSKALACDAFIVDSNTFGQYVAFYAAHVGFYPPTLPTEKDLIIAQALGFASDTLQQSYQIKLKRYQDEISSISNYPGICLPLEPGKSTILINAASRNETPEILGHELLHAMVETGNEGTGFNSETGDGHELNEASTQTLNLAVIYPDQTASQLLKSIKDQKINTAYRTGVMGLLQMVSIVESCNPPFTLENLAERYLNSEQPPSIKALLLQWELIQNMPTVPLRGLAEQLIKKIFPA